MEAAATAAAEKLQAEQKSASEALLSMQAEHEAKVNVLNGKILEGQVRCQRPIQA